MKLVIVDAGDTLNATLGLALGALTGTKPLVVHTGGTESLKAQVEGRSPDAVVIGTGPRQALPDLTEFVRSLDPKVAILGVGLGHVAIVEAFGGKAASGTGAPIHGRTSEVRHEGTPLFANVPNPFGAARYHALSASRELPAELRLTARGPEDSVMAVEHTARPIFGLQFHPESFGTPAGRQILANVLELCRGGRDAPAPVAPSGEFGIGFSALLDRLIAGSDLSRAEARSMGERLLRGEVTPVQVGALVAAFRAKGERPYELAGLALAVRDAMVRIPAKGKVVDTCGTGGDGRGTFNISTGAALLAAAAGARVAKQVDRAVTSRSGSIDAINALGLPLAPDAENAARSLENVRFAALEVARFHPALHKLVPNRRELGTRHIFSTLKPLVNPAGATRQVVGVPTDHMRELVIRSLKALGAERALVVNATDGMDELTTTAACQVSELLDDGSVQHRVLDATTLGLPRGVAAELLASSPEASAKMILDVFEGAKGTARDVIALNAAAALVVAGNVPDLKAGLELAFATLASGAARRLVDDARALARPQHAV